MTYALKARKLLSGSGINSKLVKVDASKTSEGCSHGIEITYSDFIAAVGKLKKANIPYSVLKR